MRVESLKSKVESRAASRTAAFLAMPVLLAVCTLVLSWATPVQAACDPRQQSCSTSYGVSEAFFGNGGSLEDTCSSNYCAKQSAGELTVGNTAGSSYQAQAGFNTDRVPSLTFVVSTGSINLGVLTPGTPATATATFSVKSYLADGYSVTTHSAPPSNGSYAVQAPGTPTAFNSSQEQFGINLAANTVVCGAPANYGAAPVQVPDGSFSFGAAAADYNTCGLYMYQNGDVIAQSTLSSGETDYTISYLFNVTGITPGGTYAMSQSLVATSTF